MIMTGLKYTSICFHSFRQSIASLYLLDVNITSLRSRMSPMSGYTNEGRRLLQFFISSVQLSLSTLKYCNVYSTVSKQMKNTTNIT